MSAIGVLAAGFGGIGTQDHQSDMYLPALAAAPGFTLVAAVDVTGGKGAEQAANDYQVRHYSELDEALADPDVQLVSVAAPLDARAEVITRAIRAGKHVLADKPMTASAAEASQIEALAAEQGVVVVPAHHIRLGGALRSARAAVRGGKVGLPWNVQCDFLVAGGDAVPTGELVNLALYPVDAVLALLGLPVRRVHALGGSHWHDSPDDLLTLLLDHDNGVTSTIVCGRMAPLRDLAPAGIAVHRYRVSGSHGVLAVDATRPALRLRNAGHAGNVWTGPGTVDALVDLVRAGIASGRAELGPAEAVAVARVIEAAQRSLTTGRPVRTDPVPTGSRH